MKKVETTRPAAKAAMKIAAAATLMMFGLASGGCRKTVYQSNVPRPITGVVTKPSVPARPVTTTTTTTTTTRPGGAVALPGRPGGAVIAPPARPGAQPARPALPRR